MALNDRERYFAAALCWLLAWILLGAVESWFALIPAAMTIMNVWRWMKAVDKSRRR